MWKKLKRVGRDRLFFAIENKDGGGRWQVAGLHSRGIWCSWLLGFPCLAVFLLTLVIVVVLLSSAVCCAHCIEMAVPLEQKSCERKWLHVSSLEVTGEQGGPGRVIKLWWWHGTFLTGRHRAHRAFTLCSVNRWHPICKEEQKCPAIARGVVECSRAF